MGFGVVSGPSNDACNRARVGDTLMPCLSQRLFSAAERKRMRRAPTVHEITPHAETGEVNLHQARRVCLWNDVKGRFVLGLDDAHRCRPSVWESTAEPCSPLTQGKFERPRCPIFAPLSSCGQLRTSPRRHSSPQTANDDITFPAYKLWRSGSTRPVCRRR